MRFFTLGGGRACLPFPVGLRRPHYRARREQGDLLQGVGDLRGGAAKLLAAAPPPSVRISPTWSSMMFRRYSSAPVATAPGDTGPIGWSDDGQGTSRYVDALLQVPL